MNKKSASDLQALQFLSNVLRYGLLLAISALGIGAILFLWYHGNEVQDYSVFKGEPTQLKEIRALIFNSLQDGGLSLIQLGIVLLVATPFARVVASIYVFSCQHDYLYILIASIVLLVLLYTFL